MVDCQVEQAPPALILFGAILPMKVKTNWAGVGVTVGVSVLVGVGVFVGVFVCVGVGVTGTHIDPQMIPEIGKDPGDPEILVGCDTAQT